MYVDPWGLFENGDQYLTPEHVGQILLCTLVYYAGEKLGDQNVKTYAENAAEWYRTNDSKNSYHLGLDILYSYNSEANGAGITQAFFEGLDNMFSFEGDALDTIAQGLLGEVAGTIIASVVSGLQNDVTPKDELYDFWREVQYVQDLSFKNYNTQCSFEIITDADGSYIRMTYYNEDRVKIEKDFMKQTFYAAVANAVEV